MDAIISSEPIQFVISLNKDEEFSFSASLSETLQDLHRVVAVECGVWGPFEISLLGETIVSSQPLANQTISETPIITSMWSTLTQVWGGALGFRIPLKIKRLVSVDAGIYVSLSRLFGPESNVFNLTWYRFIHHCAESKWCFIQELCDLFGNHFKCNDGKLIEIKLDQQRMNGSIDLAALPPTVTHLNVERNSLTDIYGLDQLTRKRLETLKIRKNPLLEIDLQPLVRSSSSRGNPLRLMWVCAYQINRYFSQTPEYQDQQQSQPALRQHQLVAEAAKTWIHESVLFRIMIGWREHCYPIRRSNRFKTGTKALKNSV